MVVLDDETDVGLSLAEGGATVWSPPQAPSRRQPQDFRAQYERERARADAAEARCEELRQAEREARSRTGMLKWNLDKSRDKLKAVVEDVKEVRRAANNAPALQAEVTRLEKLLSQAGVESRKRCTIMSLRMEVARLREAVPAAEAQPGATPRRSWNLAHQNEAALRHADETSWRVQVYREKGRSSRAWLWTSVSPDAVYFHIDPSRSAEVAMKLFGSVEETVVLVCDRYSAYRSLARELAGKIILQWCWAHQRRSFIDCAAGHVRLRLWCQRWIERIADILYDQVWFLRSKSYPQWWRAASCGQRRPCMCELVYRDGEIPFPCVSAHRGTRCGVKRSPRRRVGPLRSWLWSRPVAWWACLP